MWKRYNSVENKYTYTYNFAFNTIKYFIFSSMQKEDDFKESENMWFDCFHL